MFLMEGSVLFLKGFIEESTLINAANKLREIFSLHSFNNKSAEIIPKIQVQGPGICK